MRKAKFVKVTAEREEFCRVRNQANRRTSCAETVLFTSTFPGGEVNTCTRRDVGSSNCYGRFKPRPQSVSVTRELCVEHAGWVHFSLRRLGIMCFVFLALTFALSSVFWTLIIWSGRLGMGHGLIIPTLMWCPGIAALVTCRALGMNVAGLGWRWPQTRYLSAAYFIPLAYTSMAYGAVWALHLGGWNSEFFRSVGEDLGLHGMPPWASFSIAILLMATGGVIQNLSMTLGEEIGWRGLLVPRLTENMTFTGVSLFMGIIWAAWHSPLLFLADYNAGTNHWYALGCFTAMCVSMSFILTWFRLKSQSVWPAALFHASHNVFVPIVFDNLVRDTGRTLLFTTVFGAAPACASALFAFYFWTRRKEVQQSFLKRRSQDVAWTRSMPAPAEWH